MTTPIGVRMTGPLAAYQDAIWDDLRARGYASLSAQSLLRVAAHLSVDLPAGFEETAVHGTQEVEGLEPAPLDTESHEEIPHDGEARIGLADEFPGVHGRPPPEKESEDEERPPHVLFAQGKSSLTALDARGYPAVSTTLLTARLNVQFGTTQECLPDPPATMT